MNPPQQRPSDNSALVAKVDFLEKSVAKLIKDQEKLRNSTNAITSAVGPAGDPIDFADLASQVDRLTREVADLQSGKSQFLSSITKDLDELKIGFGKLKKSVESTKNAADPNAQDAAPEEDNSSDMQVLRALEAKIDIMEQKVSTFDNARADFEHFAKKSSQFATSEEVRKVKRAVVSLKKISSKSPSVFLGQPSDEPIVVGDPKDTFDQMKRIIDDLRSSRRDQEARIRVLDEKMQELKETNENLSEVPRIKKAVLSMKKKMSRGGDFHASSSDPYVQRSEVERAMAEIAGYIAILEKSQQ